MPTFAWVVYDIIFGVVGFFFLDRSLTKKEWSVVGGLIAVGIAVAVYSGYSDIKSDALITSLKEGQSYNTGQLDAIARILGPKLGVSTAVNAQQAAQAASAKIDRLQAEIDAMRNSEWPELKPKTIEALKSSLMKAGRHEFDVFSCASQDCDSFADGFRTAFFGASWFQRPNSISKLVFKFPQGWVISGYGDKTGMDALHDAIKNVLHVDVPTLNYPPNPDHYVQLMIGPKPKALQLSQQ